MLDLAGKVRYIGVNSDFDGTTELAAIKQRKQVTTLVRAVLKAPVPPSQVSEGESCILAFHLVDRTAVTVPCTLERAALSLECSSRGRS